MKSKAEYAAFMGIALALTAALSLLDSLISSAFPVPGIRLGLANIAVIAILIKYGVPSGLFISLLRSGFVFLTRGATAALMSLGGGIAAFAASVILITFMKRSLKFSCVISALCHICGQLAASCILTKSIYTLAYAPLLVPVSFLTGYLTGTILQCINKFITGKE